MSKLLRTELVFVPLTLFLLLLSIVYLLPASNTGLTSNLQISYAQGQPSILVKLVNGNADTGRVNISAAINSYKTVSSVFVNSAETDVLLSIPSTVSPNGNSSICAAIISSQKQICQNFTGSSQALNVVTLDLLQAH